jgi:hypothetical protein
MELSSKQRCRRCGKGKYLHQFRVRIKHYGKPNKIYVARTCSACCGRQFFQQLRAEFLKAFGGKCGCCGQDHPYFLTLEHIYGYEAKLRSRKTHGLHGYIIARREKWDKNKYECLCMNCNFAKGRYGQCPHRSGVTAERARQELLIGSTGVRELLGGVKRDNLSISEAIN